ncbi:MAG: septum formation initiator family protein [Veillonellaceae bacterium]|nr:septum formation initiator family protein [Veillonellaceae bacterium]
MHGRKNRKRERQQHRGINWFFILMAVIVAAFSYTIFTQQADLFTIDRNFAAAQKRLDDAKTENQILKDEKAALQEPEHIERIAREELGMTKPGEMPYISRKK